MSGKIPSTLFTPTIVEEQKELHNQFRDAVYAYLRDNNILGSIIFLAKEYRVEYFIRSYRILGRIDIYGITEPVPGKTTNYIIEVTTRTPSTITIEWLSAYMIGIYYETLQPTIGILVAPSEIRLAILNPCLIVKLLSLLTTLDIDIALHEKPKDKWLCSNCDLFSICPKRGDP